MSVPPIATATRCSCGAPVYVRHDGFQWVAWCGDCYDGAEDASDAAHVQGHGKSPDAALWSWQDDHDATHEVEVVPTSDLIGTLALDVRVERARQRGWYLDEHATYHLSLGAYGRLYGPLESAP